MKFSFVEDVFYTMCGELQQDSCIPGVEDAFAEGALCDRAYNDLSDAYERLRQRLQVEDEDSDVEQIIHAGMEITRELCFRMYEYGAKFAGRQTN